MMAKRVRMWLSVQVGLGIILAGLGHYYAAMWRGVYPLDGYVYYLFAALSFAWAWRTAQRETPVTIDLRDPKTWRTLTQSPARAVVVLTATINIAAAFLALLIPTTWLWLPLWALSILALFFYILSIASPPPQVDRTTAEPAPAAVQTLIAPHASVETRTYLETAQPVEGRINPIGLALSIGLLLIGQMMAGTLVQSAGAGSIAQSVNDALRLDLIGDPAVVLGGACLLGLGTIGYALTTRRLGLRDYSAMIVTERVAKGLRVQWGWLAVALIASLLWLVVLGQSSGPASGWGALLPFVLALMLMSACWWQVDRMRGVRHGIHLTRHEAIGLSAVLIVALILFTLRLGDLPNSIWGDEGAFLTTARDIARQSFTPDFFGFGTYALPMPGSIYQSLWLVLLGVSLAVWRLASAFAAWLAMVPLYFLVRATLGRRVAWVSLVLYAALPYLLTYARMGYETAQSLAPVTAALALAWIAVRRDSRLYAFLAGCAAGLGFYTTPAARMAIVLVPLWLLWMWITRRVRGKPIGRQLATVLLGIVIMAAPPIGYGLARAPEVFAGKQVESAFDNLFYARDLYSQDQLTTGGDPIQVGNQQLMNAPELNGVLIARGVLRTALALHASSLVHEHYLVGALADPLGVLYLLGMGWCLARLKRPGYAVWPLWLLIGGFLTSALSAYPPRAELMAPVIPALVVLGALGIVSGFDALGNVVGVIDQRVARYAVIAVTALLGVVGLRAYFVEMPQRFPPDLGNALFWEAQALPSGSSMVLILPDTWPHDYQPWGLHELDLAVQFHALTKIDLNTADWKSLCPAICRIFFAASDRDLAVSYLAQAFGDRPLMAYPDSLGGTQAYMFTVQ